jgi:hypothetical protein
MRENGRICTDFSRDKVDTNFANEHELSDVRVSSRVFSSNRNSDTVLEKRSGRRWRGVPTARVIGSTALGLRAKVGCKNWMGVAYYLV